MRVLSVQKISIVILTFAFCVILFTMVRIPVMICDLRHYSLLLTQNFSEKSGDAYEFKNKLNFVCDHKDARTSIERHGMHFVFYNFVRASRKFSRDESITYTTLTDFTFFGNLPTLVERWQGPISVAVYAPRSDFNYTLKSISYLRHCLNTTDLIKELVTFHVFIHQDHIPNLGDNIQRIYNDSPHFIHCDDSAPYFGMSANDTYRMRMNRLLFPINVARNIARQSALTHYVFAADIEFYPSMNFIRDFMEMLRRKPKLAINGEVPRVYALPIFEVPRTVHAPNNKNDLQTLFKKGKAQLLHKILCYVCHAIPKLSEWLCLKMSDKLDLFTTAKRVGNYKAWEAFYVGTKSDPLFDERLSWEGQSNKMPQRYAMCMLNYDYKVLNNAFIIHKPGIKKSKEQTGKFTKEINKSNRLIRYSIKRQLLRIYGYRKGCFL